MLFLMFWLAAVRDMIDLAHALISSFVRFAEPSIAEQAWFRWTVLLMLRFPFVHSETHVAVHRAISGSSLFEESEVAR